MSNSLESDQDRRSENVGPDLGPNCLQRLLYQQTTQVTDIKETVNISTVIQFANEVTLIPLIGLV